ncbi:hypothetical protein D9M72_647820 [compost metagenome]
MGITRTSVPLRKPSIAAYSGSTPTPMPLMIAVFIASAEFTRNGELLMVTISWPSGPSKAHFSRGMTGLTRRRHAWFSRSLGFCAQPLALT